ncbi:GNAT family N-acetyltransferase [Streptomyces polyrhachis]|uniref:GNAT family N-acetyltransferase n=1 Tax=Streptomyces polyrhachis TaxID=1282885 RepID=A0ABW2GAM3_9ACTN
MTTTIRPTGPERTGADGGRARDFEVCVNGRPVGAVEVRADAERGGRISGLRIDEGDRRRGRATVAALAAEEVLRGWGCRGVRISVPAGAAAALRLAAALGYTETNRHLEKRLGRPPELPAGSVPRPITEIEFPAWRETSAAVYVEEAVARGASREAEVRDTERYLAAQLPQGAATPTASLRILTHDGVDVGYLWVALTCPGKPGGWVNDVEVRPAHRGRGHGRTLMLTAERDCLAAGTGILGLNVFADNTPALRLYESLGYAPTAFHLAKPLA